VTTGAETTVLTGGETTLTLSPTPLPVTAPPTESSIAPTTTATTTPETTTVTTAPGAGDDAVPGDLAVPGRPMQRPPCDGGFITVLASAVGNQATAGSIAAVLEQYPGSNYLRTDQTCSSLNPDVEGEPIYVVFLGPFALDTDACAARAEGPEGAYARQLSNDVGPQHSVDCP
jgi:serine/threonine-protein kinase